MLPVSMLFYIIFFLRPFSFVFPLWGKKEDPTGISSFPCTLRVFPPTEDKNPMGLPQGGETEEKVVPQKGPTTQGEWGKINTPSPKPPIFPLLSISFPQPPLRGEGEKAPDFPLLSLPPVHFPLFTSGPPPPYGGAHWACLPYGGLG